MAPSPTASGPPRRSRKGSINRPRNNPDVGGDPIQEEPTPAFFGAVPVEPAPLNFSRDRKSSIGASRTSLIERERVDGPSSRKPFAGGTKDNGLRSLASPPLEPTSLGENTPESSRRMFNLFRTRKPSKTDPPKINSPLAPAITQAAMQPSSSLVQADSSKPPKKLSSKFSKFRRNRNRSTNSREDADHLTFVPRAMDSSPSLVESTTSRKSLSIINFVRSRTRSKKGKGNPLNGTPIDFRTRKAPDDNGLPAGAIGTSQASPKRSGRKNSFSLKSRPEEITAYTPASTRVPHSYTAPFNSSVLHDQPTQTATSGGVTMSSQGVKRENSFSFKSRSTETRKPSVPGPSAAQMEFMHPEFQSVLDPAGEATIRTSYFCASDGNLCTDKSGRRQYSFSRLNARSLLVPSQTRRRHTSQWDSSFPTYTLPKVGRELYSMSYVEVDSKSDSSVVVSDADMTHTLSSWMLCVGSVGREIAHLPPIAQFIRPPYPFDLVSTIVRLAVELDPTLVLSEFILLRNRFRLISQDITHFHQPFHRFLGTRMPLNVLFRLNPIFLAKKFAPICVKTTVEIVGMSGALANSMSSHCYLPLRYLPHCGVMLEQYNFWFLVTGSAAHTSEKEVNSRDYIQRYSEFCPDSIQHFAFSSNPPMGQILWPSTALTSIGCLSADPTVSYHTSGFRTTCTIHQPRSRPIRWSEIVTVLSASTHMDYLIMDGISFFPTDDFSWCQPLIDYIRGDLLMAYAVARLNMLALELIIIVLQSPIDINGLYLCGALLTSIRHIVFAGDFFPNARGGEHRLRIRRRAIVCFFFRIVPRCMYLRGASIVSLRDLIMVPGKWMRCGTGVRHITSAPVGNSDPWERVLMKKKPYSDPDSVAQTHLIYVVEWYYCSEMMEVPPNYAVQAVEIYIRQCSESEYSYSDPQFTQFSGPRRKGSAFAGELSLLDLQASDHPVLAQHTVSADNLRRVPKRSIVLNNQTTRDLQAALGRNKILSLRNSELILALGKKRAENLELKRVVSLSKIDLVKMAHHLRILADKIDNHTINQNTAKDAVMESTQCPICYLPMFVPDTPAWSVGSLNCASRVRMYTVVPRAGRL
ncbi:hypothetical protein B0H16DRAFT_1797802 [Mycena metata]|uniref:Uncharacterized protein n=1 Tax=Mycena metata TaxID=1033252 RepID=A0AAD7HDT9_9AGAR|nr:hypothetical protein B0H16DRAFT_1797802 [Mycena metata]